MIKLVLVNNNKKKSCKLHTRYHRLKPLFVIGKNEKAKMLLKDFVHFRGEQISQLAPITFIFGNR